MYANKDDDDYYKRYSIGSCIIIFGTNLLVVLISICVSMYNLLCLSLLCTMVYMHTFHSAHIFIVYNSVICTKSFNSLALFYNGHIVLNYIVYFVYSPLNLYVYIHWILDVLYHIILLLLYIL